MRIDTGVFGQNPHGVVCGEARCAYLFAGRRSNRIKVLVHDGVII